MLCSAFSFGKRPDMQIFFKCFIEEINQINSEGGLTISLKNGQFIKLKVLPFVFTADAPAKSDILNKVHHSGRGGCPYCEHNGTVLKGTTQVLYCNRDNVRCRENVDVRQNMIQAHLTDKTVNGYHGLSALLVFDDFFDIVSQIAIDKMHCVDLGVIRKMFNLFLEPKNRGNE